MAPVVRVALLVEVIKDARAVLFHFNYVLVADCEKFYYLGQDSTSIRIDQAGDDFISHIARRGSQHLLELTCREALDYNVLLRLFRLVLLLELVAIVLISARIVCAGVYFR